MASSWAGTDYDALFAEVYNTYGQDCIVCDKWIDTKMPANLPLSPEIDHRVPKSSGGALKDIANLGPIHKSCNQLKGKRSLEVARAIYQRTEWRTSRQWFSNSN